MRAMYIIFKIFKKKKKETKKLQKKRVKITKYTCVEREMWNIGEHNLFCCDLECDNKRNRARRYKIFIKNLFNI